MGCVIANISSQKLDPDMAVESKRIGIEITVSSQISETLPKVTCSIVRNTVDINSLRIDTLPLVTSGIICEIIGRKNLLLRDKNLRLLRTRSGKLLYVVK